ERQPARAQQVLHGLVESGAAPAAAGFRSGRSAGAHVDDDVPALVSLLHVGMRLYDAVRRRRRRHVVAWMRIRISLSSGTGFGSSVSCSTSGERYRVQTIACMAWVSGAREKGRRLSPLLADGRDTRRLVSTEEGLRRRWLFFPVVRTKGRPSRHEHARSLVRC